MYGGHITDAWDRRCNNTYLDVYMRPDILHGLEIAPGFKVPDTTAMGYTEIGVRTTHSLPLSPTFIMRIACHSCLSVATECLLVGLILEPSLMWCVNL